MGSFQRIEKESHSDEIFVDSFAGGGGTSTGYMLATGRHVDIAINHCESSIKLHQVNHPTTKHYCESVWVIDPREVTAGRQIAGCWFSPDCKHFSIALGGQPKDKNIRGLAWTALDWAATVRPRVIFLENVPEFTTWGPLDESGRPCKEAAGTTFRKFVAALEAQGYQVEWRVLHGESFGIATFRKRLILIARCDGKAIVWPTPTHGNPRTPLVQAGKLAPWKPASSIINWQEPGHSIFLTKEEGRSVGVRRPLVTKTMKRLAKGISRFVLSDKPFVVQQGSSRFYPFITEHANGSSQRNMPVTEPLRTICAEVKGGHFALVSAQTVQLRKACYIMKYYGPNIGHSLRDPLHTITTKDRFALIETLLATSPNLTEEQRYRAWWVARLLDTADSSDPAGDTCIATDRCRFVKVGDDVIVDVLMRMLQPRELYNAMGFPADYQIDVDSKGTPIPKSVQIGRCGNAVPPILAKVVIRSNLEEYCEETVAA